MLYLRDEAVTGRAAHGRRQPLVAAPLLACARAARDVAHGRSRRGAARNSSRRSARRRCSGTGATDAAKDVDATLKELLPATSFHANLLFEPWAVRTGKGEPFKVFTPFWRAARELDVRDPVPAPPGMRFLEPGSEELDDWDLLPEHPDWADGLRAAWTPGEAAAHDRLEEFVEQGLAHYDGPRRSRP